MKGWQNKSMVEISEEFQQLCDFGRAKELFRWRFGGFFFDHLEPRIQDPQMDDFID